MSEIDAGGSSGSSSGMNGHNNISKRRAIHTDPCKSNAMIHNSVSASRKNTSSNSLQLQHQQQHQHRRNSSSSLLNDSSSNGDCYGGRTTDNDHTAPTSTDNSGNSEQSDNTVIFLPPTSKPSQSKPTADIMSLRNPVLDRLTGQLPNHNALRNESYYRVSMTMMHFNLKFEVLDSNMMYL